MNSGTRSLISWDLFSRFWIAVRVDNLVWNHEMEGATCGPSEESTGPDMVLGGWGQVTPAAPHSQDTGNIRGTLTKRTCVM